MSKKQDRTIYRREDGKWVNKRNSSIRATSVHDTQADAIDAARQNLQNQGSGELTTKGRDGQIKSKDTIKQGNDPNPVTPKNLICTKAEPDKASSLLESTRSSLNDVVD